jgi:hypothetical protein
MLGSVVAIGGHGSNFTYKNSTRRVTCQVLLLIDKPKLNCCVRLKGIFLRTVQRTQLETAARARCKRMAHQCVARFILAPSASMIHGQPFSFNSRRSNSQRKPPAIQRNGRGCGVLPASDVTLLKSDGRYVVRKLGPLVGHTSSVNSARRMFHHTHSTGPVHQGACPARIQRKSSGLEAN